MRMLKLLDAAVSGTFAARATPGMPGVQVDPGKLEQLFEMQQRTRRQMMCLDLRNRVFSKYKVQARDRIRTWAISIAKTIDLDSDVVTAIDSACSAADDSAFDIADTIRIRQSYVAQLVRTYLTEAIDTLAFEAQQNGDYVELTKKTWLQLAQQALSFQVAGVASPRTRLRPSRALLASSAVELTVSGNAKLPNVSCTWSVNVSNCWCKRGPCAKT